MENLRDFSMVQVKGSQVYVMLGLSFCLDSKHYFCLKCTAGKENRAELYALWVLLKAVEERGLEHFQFFGDSKLMSHERLGKSTVQHWKPRSKYYYESSEGGKRPFWVYFIYSCLS